MMLLVELAGAFGVGGLLGIAVDASWARGKGFEEGFRAGVTSRPPSAGFLAAKAVGDKITEDAMKEFAARDQPNIPHGQADHWCTSSCYFHPEHGSAW